MSTLKGTLADYLRRIGQFEPQPLGQEPRQANAEDAQFLRESLLRRLRFNDSMIVVMLALLCGLFLLESYLILAHRDALTAVSVLAAMMLGIVGYLRHLWLEKSTMDVLILSSISLPPEETARLVTAFYFKAIRLRAQKTAGGP